MIALYLRVSTEDQSTEAQRGEIQKWVTAHCQGQEVAWYEDHKTGTNVNRAGFRKLQSHIASGKVKTVVAWKWDRLSRNCVDGMQILCEWLKAGVRIVSITQNMDYAGPLGLAIATFFFAMAEEENNARRERQRIGIERAKANGVYKGSKPGYRKARPASIVTLKERGMTAPEISKLKGISVRSVVRYLKEAGVQPASEQEPS